MNSRYNNMEWHVIAEGCMFLPTMNGVETYHLCVFPKNGQLSPFFVLFLFSGFGEYTSSTLLSL